MTLTAVDHYDESMERIIELDLQGLNATQIAKETGLQRKVVVASLQEIKAAWQNDAEARDLARDHLNKLVKHYDILIKKSYDLMDEIDALNMSHQVAAQKNAILRTIGDFEAKRVDVLQKAGLLESAEIGDEIAQWEEEKQSMLSILRDLCTVCQSKVGNRIMKLNGETVPEQPVYDVEVVEQ